MLSDGGSAIVESPKEFFLSPRREDFLSTKVERVFSKISPFLIQTGMACFINQIDKVYIINQKETKNKPFLSR